MIIHLITGLNVGGAELALFRLLEGLSEQERPNHRVVCMIEPGPVAAKIEALGVMVASLGMKPGRITYGGMLRLIKLLSAAPGWHLQGWMYHANLMATAACVSLFKPRNHIWSIRHSLTQLKSEKFLTRYVIQQLAMLSLLPRRIVYVAKRSAQQHEDIFYARSRTQVIPVGYDVAGFAPGDGALLRGLVNTTAPLIAHVGRWDWSKDHANFLAAMAQVPNAHAVLIGRGVDASNPELMALIMQHDLHERVHLLGHRDDVNRLLPGADLLCLSSVTEAQPNAVGEAMACGVPCVVTDVGDAADLVGDTGWVVPSKNSKALADALHRALGSDLKAKGAAARARILAHYTRERMIEAYRKLYSELGWA